MSLAEIQQAIRDLVVDGRSDAAEAFVDARWHRRLQQHQRNYEASLVAAVMQRFPATQWLVGSEPVYDAARAFVHAAPPEAPCIAEYAAHFPAFISVWPTVAHVPFLAAFAELDWHLGRIALATDPSSPDGVHVLSCEWPIDRLFARFLDPAVADESDESFQREPVRLEVRGMRGQVTFRRVPC